MARIQRGRGPYFSQIPWELQDDKRADAGAIATYAALRRYADFGGSGGATASHKTLAEKAHLSEKAIRQKLELLRDLGWVGWESGKTAGRTNAYVVNASLGGSVPGTDPSVSDADPGRYQVPTTESHDTESHYQFDARPYVDAWREAYGGEPPGSLFKALKPLHEQSGPETTLRRFKNFLAATPAQFVTQGTPLRFAQTFGSWDAPRPNGRRDPRDELPGETADAYLTRQAGGARV